MVFFFNDTATTEIYTLSLHDALPICRDDELLDPAPAGRAGHPVRVLGAPPGQLHQRRHGVHGSAGAGVQTDRKSTRLNSSHANISYAVFCLKKKNNLQYLSSLVVYTL